MTISIIIAAYNIENYIEKCLKSIEDQTSSKYEVIIVNDGSTDKTQKKIIDFIGTNNKFKLINQENKGLIEARKSGLKYATGEYIYFLDGDDWLENTMVELVLEKLGNKTDILLINSKLRWKTGKEKKYELYSPVVKLDIESVLVGNIYPAIWGKIIKKSFIDDNEIIFMDDVTYGEDLAITAALFANNPTVEFIDKPLHNYFIRDTSITNTVNEKIYDVNKVIEYVEKIINEKYGSKYNEQLEALYIDKLIEQAYFSSVSNKEIRRKILEQFRKKQIIYTKEKLQEKKYRKAKKLQNINNMQESLYAFNIRKNQKIRAAIQKIVRSIEGVFSNGN